jgi:DNA-directed RNA polymerase III subunit RPC8
MDVSILKVPVLSYLKLMIAEFRMTVFRPFVGEVLSGRIMAATHRGIRISLEFFDDIFIPEHLLFSTAKLYYTSGTEGETNGSDHGTQSWKLPVGTEFNYLEKDDVIRFKVEEETFKEATPAPPKVVGSGETEQHRIEEHKEPIYSLIVLIVPFSANSRGVVRKTGWESLNGGRIEV